MNLFPVAAVRACLLVAAATQLSGCDDGRYGELVTKQIYADMIALYEGGICPLHRAELMGRLCGSRP